MQPTIRPAAPLPAALPRPPARPVAPTTYDVLPQELQNDIARLVYIGSPRNRDAAALVGQLQGLSALNRRWECAYAQPLAAAGDLIRIQGLSTGKQLASAIQGLSALPEEMQCPGWDAVEDRLRPMRKGWLSNTVKQYLALWPERLPVDPPSLQWNKQRDTALARFARATLKGSTVDLEVFVNEVLRAQTPMPELVAVLLATFAKNVSDSARAKILDRCADHMPHDCRRSFQAMSSCMRHAEKYFVLPPQLLEKVQALDPSLQCVLLPQLEGRINGPQPEKFREAFIDAIQALPTHFRAIALRAVSAYGWHLRRTEMLLECLPADPKKAAEHLEAYLLQFGKDSGGLNVLDAFNVLEPVFQYVTESLKARGTSALCTLLAWVACRSPAYPEKQRTILLNTLRFAEAHPDCQPFRIRLLARCLLEPHGEPRMIAMRQELQKLVGQPTEVIVAALDTLTDRSYGVPSYLFMSNLLKIGALVKALPAAEQPRIKAMFGRLSAKWPAEEMAAIKRELQLPFGVIYTH